MHTQELLLMIASSALVWCTPTPRAEHSSLPFANASHTIPLSPLSKELEIASWYSAEVLVGSRILSLAMDTGSSDFWMVAEDTECQNPTASSQMTNSDGCNFTSTSKFSSAGGFDVIPDVHLNVSYVNNAIINGPLGYSEVVVGGLTVPRQVVSPASLLVANPLALTNITGILGLAYPGVTSAYPGNDPSKDIICTGNSSCGPIPYSPFLTTLFQDGLTEPVFAFALSRSEKFGGVMTIGGIPRLDDPFVNATGPIIATTPIVPVGNATERSVYVINVDNLAYANSTSKAGEGQYLVDTGTVPNFFPKDQADAINAQFDPPAYFNETIGEYFVSCDAKAPDVGISIGGQMFYHNEADMIINAAGQCVSAVQTQATAGKLGLLGASWMKSVLAVFDVGASEMTFVGRRYYEDS